LIDLKTRAVAPLGWDIFLLVKKKSLEFNRKNMQLFFKKFE
jgi:hypothetical protein